MALKKPQPKMDPSEFLTLFKEAVESGLADTMLPDFYDVIDGRIRWYQGGNGNALDAEFYEALQVQRKIRRPAKVAVTLGYEYSLLGAKYQGVVVKVLEIPFDALQCRVEVVQTTDGQLALGDTYKVPTGALVPFEEGA